MIITHANVAVCACVYMGDVVCVIIDTINYADINKLECTKHVFIFAHSWGFDLH